MTWPAAGARRWWTWGASLLVTVSIFSYLLNQVPPRRLVEAVSQLALEPLAGYGALVLVSIAARALRFWVLLGRQVALLEVTAITMVRNLFVDLLPSRLGELSYVYLLTKHAGRRVEDGVATLMVAAVLDLIALIPLLLLAVLTIGVGPTVPAGWIAAACLAAAGAGLYGVRLAAPVAGRAADWFDARNTPRTARLAARLRLLADSFMRTRAALLPALALSLVVRGCKYGAIYFLILAIMTPLGYTSETLPFVPVFLAALSAEVASALPLHGFAGFGTHEAAWSVSLSRFGFSEEHAILSGILGHLLGQVVEYSMGALALLWLIWYRPARQAGVERI